MDLIGNYTALVTPFKNNLTIDHLSLEKLCNFQLNNFSDGIVALGSTAEATALDVYEKHKIMETITKTIENKLPIIAGINAFTLEDAIYQCEARFLDGASAVLVSPPPYIKPTQKGLLNYFTKIADHSYIPVILYNIPSRTGVTLTTDLIAILSKHPNIIGIKDASGDISYTQNIIHTTRGENFSILAGNDNQLLPILALGGTGVISVIGNIAPQLFHDIIYHYHNNEIYTAKKLYLENLDLINRLSIETNPIPIKYALNKLGMINFKLRPPLASLTSKNRKILNNTLKEFNLC